MNDQIYYLTTQKRRTSHILHLLLCIPTCGLWLFVWGMAMRSNDWHNRKIDLQISQILSTKGRGASNRKEAWTEIGARSKW